MRRSRKLKKKKKSAVRNTDEGGETESISDGEIFFREGGNGPRDSVTVSEMKSLSGVSSIERKGSDAPTKRVVKQNQM